MFRTSKTPGKIFGIAAALTLAAQTVCAAERIESEGQRNERLATTALTESNQNLTRALLMNSFESGFMRGAVAHNAGQSIDAYCEDYLDRYGEPSPRKGCVRQIAAPSAAPADDSERYLSAEQRLFSSGYDLGYARGLTAFCGEYQQRFQEPSALSLCDAPKGNRVQVLRP